jgi:hypothetical protein
VDVATRRREVSAAAQLVAAHSSGPWPFAYPYGGVPPRPGDLLGPAGFAAAFTTSPGERRGPYRIGRRDADAWPHASRPVSDFGPRRGRRGASPPGRGGRACPG